MNIRSMNICSPQASRAENPGKSSYFPKICLNFLDCFPCESKKKNIIYVLIEFSYNFVLNEFLA